MLPWSGVLLAGTCLEESWRECVAVFSRARSVGLQKRKHALPEEDAPTTVTLWTRMSAKASRKVRVIVLSA